MDGLKLPTSFPSISSTPKFSLPTSGLWGKMSTEGRNMGAGIYDVLTGGSGKLSDVFSGKQGVKDTKAYKQTPATLYEAQMGSFWNTSHGQPGAPSKNVAYSYVDKSYFTLTADSLPAIKARGFSEEAATALVNEAIWQFIPTAYSERHAEASCIHNVMSDTYLAFATGAMPIQFALNAMLFLTQSEDHRLDFISFYHKMLRGTKLTELNVVLNFVLKDTTMKAKLLAINVDETADYADMVSIALTGIGYAYKVQGVQYGA